MSFYRQHRDEIDDYAENFADRLGSGEELNGTPTVTFWQSDGDGWTDQSNLFEDPAPALGASNTRVEYRVNPKDTVIVGDYTVRVEAPTDAGRNLIETPTLEIHADPD